MLCLTLIVLNTIVIGVETHITTGDIVRSAKSNYKSDDSVHSEELFRSLEIGFLVWMIIEVSVNAYAQRRDFICGKDRQWNFFDVFMLVMAASMQFTEMVSVSFLRVARLFRLIKILRAFRMVKFLRSVRSMMISIIGSMMHLLSAMLVMCIFMYVVALVIMQGLCMDIDQVAVEHAPGARSLALFSGEYETLTALDEIDALYGTIPNSMMTLFLTVSGGLEWSKAAEPLVRLNAYFGVIWTAYIGFMVFGMLNVLTGIFVEAAMDPLNNDRDNMIQAQIEERQALISTITNVFRSKDTDGSGLMTEEEMELLLQDNELTAYLKAMGIDGTEVKGFFTLLDDDASGTVSIDA